ncbi:hypothetical protein PIB30_038944 [Stylosanthes scabra]|uniref:Uncharacterized protein n=1 Tax=Stylosanthes scabra TaxID=79078 RepID=A0ABU6UEM0_9FABA|nr:hypothetical protein [Stylosanthes scabra]
MAEDDTEAATSVIADPRQLLIWDGHGCWDDVRKGTKEITSVFMEHYKLYAPNLAKHLTRQSAYGERSDGRYSGSLEVMRPTCARLGRSERQSTIEG